MMKLSLKPPVFGCKDKIPVATCAAVVAPVRNRRIVTENRVEGHFGLVVVPKILGPRVDLFLPCGVPWHLTAEWIGFLPPAFCATAHSCFKVVSFLFPAFTPKVVENLKKNVSLHLAKDRQLRRELGHCNGCFICLVQIPIPRMIRYKPFVIAS